MTHFHLVYGGEAVALAEIRSKSAQVDGYDEANAEKCLLKLNLVEETRDKVASLLRVYKQKMCQAYNLKVISHSFQVDDFVWKKA